MYRRWVVAARAAAHEDLNCSMCECVVCARALAIRGQNEEVRRISWAEEAHKK